MEFTVDPDAVGGKEERVSSTGRGSSVCPVESRLLSSVVRL